MEVSHGTKDELTHLSLRKTHRGGGTQQSSWRVIPSSKQRQAVCIQDFTISVYPPQAIEKGGTLSEAGQSLDKPLGGPEAYQSRGASGSLKREELALLEQG